MAAEDRRNRNEQLQAWLRRQPPEALAALSRPSLAGVAGARADARAATAGVAGGA